MDYAGWAERQHKVRNHKAGVQKGRTSWHAAMSRSWTSRSRWSSHCGIAKPKTWEPSFFDLCGFAMCIYKCLFPISCKRQAGFYYHISLSGITDLGLAARQEFQPRLPVNQQIVSVPTRTGSQKCQLLVGSCFDKGIGFSYFRQLQFPPGNDLLFHHEQKSSPVPLDRFLTVP